MPIGVAKCIILYQQLFPSAQRSFFKEEPEKVANIVQNAAKLCKFHVETFFDSFARELSLLRALPETLISSVNQDCRF